MNEGPVIIVAAVFTVYATTFAESFPIHAVALNVYYPGVIQSFLYAWCPWCMAAFGALP